MPPRGSSKKRPFNPFHPAASQHDSTANSSSTGPLLLGSALHNTAPPLNAGSWMNSGQSPYAPPFDTSRNASITRQERTYSRPAEQVSALSPQRGYTSIFDASTHAPLVTVPLAPAFGPNHILRDSSRNAIPVSAPAPVPSNLTPRGGSPLMPASGYYQSNLGPSTFLPLPSALPAHSVEKFTFIGENPANTVAKSRKKRLLTEAQGQAMKSTIRAGGACVWCQAKKKKCGDLNPCKACAQNNAPCIRGSSLLCLASTIKNNACRQQVDPGNFQEARDVMTLLKENAFSYGMVPYTSVFVDWALDHYPEQYSRTWNIEADKLDLHQLDATIQASVIKLALGFVTVPHFENSSSDTLEESALVMVKLLAAIDQLSRSKVSVQPMAVGIARMTVFFLLTVYAKEMCEASLRFSIELYSAIRDRRLTESSVQYAIRVYSQVINEMMAFQLPGSLMSRIFVHIQPRLEGTRDTIQRLLSFSMSEQGPDAHDTVAPKFSPLNPFDIAIGFRPAVVETLSTAASREAMCHDQLPYLVTSLLREDFHEGMIINASTISETIDPQWLSPEMTTQSIPSDFEGSTHLYSAGAFGDIFSNAFGDSQNTDITYPQLDGAALYSSLLDSTTSEYLTNINNGGEAFLNIGTHFSS